MKPMQPDDVLAEVVGNKAIPRTEITKKLWAYIKKNGLQDTKIKGTSMPMTSSRQCLAGKKPSICSR